MEYVEPISIISLVLLCLGLVRMMNGKLKNKVSRPECHQAQKAVKQRIDDLSNHIDIRFSDLKDFIQKNGK